MHYYQFNIGDYASHTSRLSPMEDLAYRRLLDLYYLNEHPLNGCATDVAREIGLVEHVTAVEYVLSKFFTFENDCYKQKRIDFEIKKYKSNHKNKSKAGIASAKARQAKAKKQVTGVEQVLNTKPTDEQRNINQEPLTKNHKPVIKDLLCEEAFAIFYSAGLVKKSKVKALSTFKSLVKQMECDPMEFAELLKSDVQYRINNNQFGINKLHPSTYLNQQRWTDEHDSEKSNNGYAQGDRKKSAAERIRERNEREYGSQQPGSVMGMATDGGDIRGAVGEGTRGSTIIDMESSSQQSDPSRS